MPLPSRTALLIALASSPALSEACPQYDAAVAAVTAADLSTATILYEAVVLEPLCDDPFRDWMAAFLARENFAIGMDDTLTADARRAAYEAALGYEQHWRTYAALARLAWDARDYTSAAEDYQLAINELVDGPASHEATEDEIAEVYQLASAAVALSDQPVAMPLTRAGEPGGLFAQNIRGFEVEEVPLPITFFYDSAEFDATGAAYAEMLAEHLVTFAPDTITLSGHTDPIGGDAYNQTLSEDRAAALADFLRGQGYQGDIIVQGFGRTQLPPAPPGIADGSEEHYRIARRVTFGED
jgi:outer membrane protein OmpA-like peptidoglycan-associated protein